MGCSCLNPEKTRNSIKITARQMEGAGYSALNQQINEPEVNRNLPREESKTNSNNNNNNTQQKRNPNRLEQPSQGPTNINSNNNQGVEINRNTNPQRVNEVASNNNNNNQHEPLQSDNQNMNEYFDSSSSSISNSAEEEIIRRNAPYLQSKLNPNFNFPEVSDYVGTGLKRMKGYICPVSKEELEKRRNDFWTSRIEGDHTAWAIIRACCENPETENIKAFLEAGGIKPANKCINFCYDLQGAVYEVPNYCINDPVFYDEKAKDLHRPEEKQLNLRIRNCNSNTEFRMKVSNYTKNSILIERITIYLQKEDNTINSNSVRLFYCGRELKKDEDLWSYNINEENIIQIFIRKVCD